MLIAQDIYSNYCSGDKLRSDATLNAGVDVVIEQVPIGLKFGSGNTKEKTSYLCSKYQQWYQNNAQSVSIAVSTSDRAIDAWQRCKELEKEEVFFSVNPSRELIGFGVRRGSDVINFLGMNYKSEEMTCFGPFGSDGQQIIINDATRFTLTSAKEQPITCRRTMKTAGNGVEFIPETEVAIMAEGRAPLIVPLPRDEVYEPSHSSELKSQLDNLARQLAATKSELADARSSLSKFENNLKIKTNIVLVSDKPREGYSHFKCEDPGWREKFNKYVQNFCGAKQPFVHKMMTTPDGYCGFTYFSVSCIAD
jgi:hypothetical protein